MTTYLVTGGAGFIGSHLVEALLAAGHAVRVLDNFATGRSENLAAPAARFPDQLEVVEGDVRAYHLVQAAVQGVEIVLHQAALGSVPRSVADPLTSNAVNVSGTLNVLYAARQAGVQRVVMASSSSVYGANPALPKQEDQCPQPRSPYAISKLAAEQYALSFWPLYGLETVALRYFNVFGPRQDPHSQYAAVIPRFIAALLGGKPLTVHGDGLQSRDFTYVDNVVQANLLACTAPDAPGQAFNVACGERTTLLDLVGGLAQLTGLSPVVVHTPPRSGDVAHSLADIARAHQVLGYAPAVGFAEGLRRTLAWFRGEVVDAPPGQRQGG